jgi:hypothetical protein
LAFKDENAFYQDADFYTFLGNWPNCNINKLTDLSINTKPDFNDKNYSKNWILSDDFYLLHKENIKKAKLFPVNSWTNMDVVKSEVYETNPIANFKINRLNEQDIEPFTTVINESFKKELVNKKQVLKMMQNDAFTCFTGKYKNKVVSTTVFYNDNQTIGLYFIATNKDFQKKGFAGKTIKTGMNHFIQKGATKFILHATSAGKKLYENLDFTTRDKMRIFVKI